jgi:hypothetical protein
MYIASHQTSEAGNVKYFSELHARSFLRFIIRLQEDAWIVPIRALGWATDPRNYGKILAPKNSWPWAPMKKFLVMRNWKRLAVVHRLEHQWRNFWWCATGGGSQLYIADKKTSAAIERSISGSRNTRFSNTRNCTVFSFEVRHDLITSEEIRPVGKKLSSIYSQYAYRNAYEAS